MSEVEGTATETAPASQPIQLPAFRLYGLFGCPHCETALQFIRSKNMSCDIVVANGDPIIAAGCERLIGQNSYPVLISRISNEVIHGYKPEEYERLAQLYSVTVSAGTGGMADNTQHPDGPSATAPSNPV